LEKMRGRQVKEEEKRIGKKSENKNGAAEERR